MSMGSISEKARVTKWLALSVVLLLLIGVGARLIRQSTRAPDEAARRTFRQSMAAQEQRLIAVETTRLAGSDAERASLVGDALRSGAIDEHAKITTVQREGLLQALSSRLSAMSSPNAEEYVTYAKAEPSRWIEPTDMREWAMIESVQEHLGIIVDRNDPSGSLSRFYAAQLGQFGAIAEIGRGVEGSQIIFAVIRSEGALEQALYPGDDAYAYWETGPTTAPFVFRHPAVATRDVLRQQGSALVARSYAVVRKENRGVMVLRSTWCWDPATQRWHCQDMTNRGRTKYAVHF